ncbi:MAG: hypothetical protein ACI8RA_002678 [Chlamydiales bacterium]|jgi:hypothetical protein
MVFLAVEFVGLVDIELIVHLGFFNKGGLCCGKPYYAIAFVVYAWIPLLRRWSNLLFRYQDPEIENYLQGLFFEHIFM